MDTDGHGYEAIGESERLTCRVTWVRPLLSVSIRVHPWLSGFGFFASAEFGFNYFLSIR